MLSFAGAGLAAMAVSSQRGIAWAQVREEAENEPIAIVRKGIDKYLNVINVDLLEADAKSKLSECVYVFISHGAGEQWTLRENLRAFGDYSFVPQRMGGVVREKIDTSIIMLGERLPHPVFVSPMGSHGLVHPEAEIATAEGAAKSGGLVCVSSASTSNVEEIGKSTSGPKWFQMYLNVDQGISRGCCSG
jgi:lactate oxidase